MALSFLISRIPLEMRVLWRISRAAFSKKENFLITLKGDGIVSHGEVSPNSRYGESHEIIERQFHEISQSLKDSALNLKDLPGFLEFLNDSEKKSRLSHSLRCGLENAYLHAHALALGKSIFEVLEVPSVTSAATCFSVPIMPENEIAPYLEPLKRFQAIKVKVNAEQSVQLVREVSRHTDQRLYIDGNETWQDADSFLHFCDQVQDCAVEFIEQPFPSSRADLYEAVKTRSPFTLIADESIEAEADFDRLSCQFHGVNVKLMKTGGMFRAAELLKAAQKRGMKTMLGCMIETSLGIQSAVVLSGLADYCDLDGHLLISNDPFAYLREEKGRVFLNQKEGPASFAGPSTE